MPWMALSQLTSNSPAVALKLRVKGWDATGAEVLLLPPLPQALNNSRAGAAIKMRADDFRESDVNITALNNAVFALANNSQQERRAF